MYKLKTVVCNRTRRENCSRRRVALAALLLYLWPAAAAGQCFYRSAPKKLPSEVKLIISTERLAVRISNPLVVHVELSNRSGAPVSMVDRLAPERDYELHLLSTKGNEAPLTEFARKLRFGPLRYSSSRVVLVPGEKYAVDEDLATIYAVAEPGQYVLEACRDLIGVGNLYSNKLVITFTP